MERKNLYDIAFRLIMVRRSPTVGQACNHSKKEGLMGFFSSFFSTSNKKNQMIEWAIETLGGEGSVLGTAYKEISYADVVSYMQNSNCRPINSIKDAHNGWVDFEATVKGNKYVVTLSRTHDGHGSVLTSNKA